MKLPCRPTLGLAALLMSSYPHLNRAENATDVYSNETETVECPDNQKVFLAQTEFILEGRNDFFDSIERTDLQTAFVDIYNMITRDSCDSNFRRLDQLQFVTMSNQMNETISFEDIELLEMLEEGPPNEGLQHLANATSGTGFLAGGAPPLAEGGPPVMLPPGGSPPGGDMPAGGSGPPGGGIPPGGDPSGGGGPPSPPTPFGKLRRRLQFDMATTSSSTSNTTSSSAGVNVVYNVTGTCRECALSPAGSFSLFDDSFRLRIRYRVLSVQERQPPGGPPGGGLPGGTPLGGGGLPGTGGPPQDGQPPPEDAPLMAAPAGDMNDCTCAAGLEPTVPQAPSAPMLLEFLNERLLELQEQQGILENVRFQDLLQLDDLQKDATYDTDVAVQAEVAEEPLTTEVLKARTKEHLIGKAAASNSLDKQEYSGVSSSGSMTRRFQTPFLLPGMAILSFVLR